MSLSEKLKVEREPEEGCSANFLHLPPEALSKKEIKFEVFDRGRRRQCAFEIHVILDLFSLHQIRKSEVRYAF